MANYPSNLRYTKDHEWARLEGNRVKVGISAYAVAQLGDITLVELPAVGTTVETHQRLGDIESVKTVSELFSPVGGKVVERNEALGDKPELVNESCYEDGWMVVIELQDPQQLETLLDAQGYSNYVQSLDDH